YGFSRMTINRALRELTDEGWLVRLQGVGTFVAEPKGQSALFEDRPGEKNKVEAITQRATAAFSQIKDAMVFAFNLPAIVELGTA
ncbi:GntR family transcriptional regulator, partial [Salmonella enterica subsp. enterica serovar Virginia]|nr:GntR family transcriptional regulator [Salmonella enterica subsp. enterica serovar Virginia]